MKVLQGVLVSHTKKENTDAETRFYKTQLDEVAKGDIFAVWAHGKLTFFKVKKVFAKYEYIKSENGGVALEDVPQTLNRIDFKSYNILKAVSAKTKRLTAALQERIIEGKASRDLAADLASLKGESKADAKALLDALKELETNPESALDNED